MEEVKGVGRKVREDGGGGNGRWGVCKSVRGG